MLVVIGQQPREGAGELEGPLTKLERASEGAGRASEGAARVLGVEPWREMMPQIINCSLQGRCHKKQGGRKIEIL